MRDAIYNTSDLSFKISTNAREQEPFSERVRRFRIFCKRKYEETCDSAAGLV